MTKKQRLSKKIQAAKQANLANSNLAQAKQPVIAPSKNTPDKLGKVKFVKSFTPFDYSTMAFGVNQKNKGAPLSVPLGFTTEIPYNTGINAAIIQNPSPIPVSNYWSIACSDPTVFGSLLYLITCITARIGDYCNPDSEVTQKVVRDTIERIGKRKLLHGLLTSLWAGFADIRLNWDIVDGMDQIVSIQVLPQNSILLMVTPDGQIDPDTGVIQYYYNMGTGFLQNPASTSNQGNAPLAAYGSTMTPNRTTTLNGLYATAIPEDYVIHHANNPIGLPSNYYGVSMLQSIYAAIVGKANQLEKMGIASTYKAAPMVLFYTDTQTMVDDGSGKFIPMAENLELTMEQGASTGYLIIEGKGAVEHHVIDNTADLEKMATLVYLYNDEIRTGLVTPNLVGNSGSYANAMANTEANSDIIDNLTLSFIDTLLNKLVKKIIKYSIDDTEKPENIGYFELKDNSLEERAIWAKVLEVGKSLGVINPKSLDDVNLIRSKLGLASLTELDDDVIFNMTNAMSSGLAGININKTKQDVNTPYANGGTKAIKQKQYSGS